MLVSSSKGLFCCCTYVTVQGARVLCETNPGQSWRADHHALLTAGIIRRESLHQMCKGRLSKYLGVSARGGQECEKCHELKRLKFANFVPRIKEFNICKGSDINIA